MASGSNSDASKPPPFKELQFKETWSINKMAFRNVRKVESDIFTAEDISYSFILNNKHRTDKEKMYFYMYVEVPHGKTVEVEYTFKCGNYTKHFKYFFPQTSLHGSNCFCCKNYQEKYVKSGWMDIAVSGVFKIANAPPPSTSPPAPVSTVVAESPVPSLPASLLSMDSEKVVEFTQKHDFIVIVEDQEIRAHKSILRQHMTLFDTVFKVESPEHKINDLSFDVVKAAIGFCYGHEIPSFDIQKLIALFKFCQVNGMNDLLAVVENEMSSKINASNAVLLANTSLKIRADKLHENCIKFLLENSLCKGIDFKGLDISLKAELFDRSH
uniref:BTB domain-containing protein n=1 Tax=Panagrolaimus sp. PS1159 TaxID=55785 RepID=A0AC35GYC4_9BILA